MIEVQIPELDRRSFLLAMTLPLYAEGPLQAFTAQEAGMVEALCDCAIPEDDAPGAKRAGVLYYIDRQLAGALNRFLPAYRAGLPKLEAVCRQRTGQPFLELQPQARTAFLLDIEKAGGELSIFWRTVVDHTMQGFYGGPENGGNRDEVSWQMLGITSLFQDHRH